MPLNVKPDQSRLTTLLTDTVVLLCKNGLNFQSTLRIVGVLGITIDDSDVFIVHLNENVSSIVPETPSDVTSYSNSAIIDKPRNSGVDGSRSFHAEKQRVVPHSPRLGKSLGRTNNKPMDCTQESRSKGSTLPEDGLIKTDRGSRESDHASDIRIKEENVEVISEEGTDKNSSYVQEEEEGDCGGALVVSRRQKRTFKWTREIGHIPISDPTDYVTRSNETFAQNEGRGAELHGGMEVADDWNLDMLALSSLPGAVEGDAGPPWPGYVWAGGTYPQECLAGEMSHAQSQSMVFRLFLLSFVYLSSEDLYSLTSNQRCFVVFAAYLCFTHFCLVR